MVQQRFQTPRYKMVKLWLSSQDLERKKTFTSILRLETDPHEKDRNLLQQDSFNQHRLGKDGCVFKLWAQKSDVYLEDSCKVEEAEDIKNKKYDS